MAYLKKPPLRPLISRFWAKLAKLESRSPLSKLCELDELGTLLAAAAAAEITPPVAEVIGTVELVELNPSPPGIGDTPVFDRLSGCSTSPNASKTTPTKQKMLKLVILKTKTGRGEETNCYKQQKQKAS